MIFNADLEDSQANATRMVAETFALTISETVEFMVLSGAQEVVLGLTRPGMTPAEVSRRMQEHTDRLVLELKGRRTGGSVAPT